jgi:DNA-binding GntR family transcriptional regulator
MSSSAGAGRQAPSERVYSLLRTSVLRGAVKPGQPLRPQELADEHGASLAVAREALLRLVGEGLAERLQNRGFAVPDITDDRWQQLAEARAIVEPAALRLSIERGDLDWEARVRAAHHRLAGTSPYDHGDDTHYSDQWATVHRAFHRTLLDACGNDVLLEAFDRMWTATELARRWSASIQPLRDAKGEHASLEAAALARDADTAVRLLTSHILGTATALTTP